MRITRSMLADTVQRLNAHLGRPDQAWTADPKTGHIKHSNEGHLHILSNSPGDGWTRYQLAEISGKAGGVNTISAVCNAQEMHAYLRGVWDALESRLQPFHAKEPSR